MSGWKTSAGWLLASASCLALAVPQAQAQEPPPSQPAGDAALDELLGETAESNPAPAPEAPPAELAPATQEAADGPEILPVVPVATKPEEPAPRLREPPQSPQIEEVVVTATKRDKALSEIPASIVALSGADLERRGAQGVEDIVKLVPGVNITADLGIPRITIRGIAAETGTNLTTGVLYGNVSFTDAYVPVVALDPNPFDLASVEVLKGPQGTLFGAGALNGAIRYVPTPPDFDEAGLRWFTQYNSLTDGDAGFTYGAAVNLPFAGNTAALRITAFDRDSPGSIDNQRLGIEDADSTEQQGVRAILGWRPTEDWDIALTYAWQDTHVADYSLADNTEGRRVSNNRPLLSPKDTTYDFASLVLDRAFDWGSFVSESAWVDKLGVNHNDQSRGFSNGALPLVALNLDTNSQTWSQEFRLTSAEDASSNWQWLVGVFGSRQDVATRQSLGTHPILPQSALLDLMRRLLPTLHDFLPADGSVPLLSVAVKAEIEEYALFGDLTRYLGDSRQFEINVGGRLYRTVSGGVNRRSGALVLVLFGEPADILEGEVSETGFNPKLSLLWHFTDEANLYVAASKGFRVGGVQPGATLPISATQAPDIFESDTLWNYETGLRSRWLDNSLQVDVTGFLIRWDNAQTIQRESTGLSNYLDNVGGVKSSGVDLSINYLTPIPGMSLGVSGSYAKTVTTEDFRTGAGPTAPAGSPWPYAPRWQTATTLAQLLPLGDWLLGASVTHTYMGTAINNLAERERIFNYRQLDLNFEVRNEELPVLQAISIGINNLLDEAGMINYIHQGLLGATDITYIQPRNLVLRVSGSF